jgi:serine/threonine protein kinase
MATTLDYHVLNFFQDDQGGSALTVLAGATRYHVIVDEQQLKDTGKPGASILKEYRDLYDQVKRQDEAALEGRDTQGEKDDAQTTFSDGTHDSGVDMTADADNTNEQAASKASNTDACEVLQKWIMAPLADVLDKSEMLKKHKTVQDWYHCPTKLYQLSVSNGNLIGREEEPATADLDDRMVAFIPDMPLPKYLRDLSIDMIPASEVHILSESTDPEPIHPALVEVHGEQLFLKVVDMNQLQPTKREIHLMKRMEKKGLHEQFRMPTIRGLVTFTSTDKKENKMKQNNSSIMGFLMTAISNPTPLTHKLDPAISQSQRDTWANECARIVKILHDNKIIWGDAKADNFMVDDKNDLWIIDFGGSYTEGWVDPELKETEEGDDMGLRKITAALHDPEENTFDPNEDWEGGEEVKEEVEKTQKQEEDAKGKKAPKLEKESSLFVTEVVSEEKAIRAVSSSAEVEEAEEEKKTEAPEDSSNRKRKVDASRENEDDSSKSNKRGRKE